MVLPSSSTTKKRKKKRKFKEWIMGPSRPLLLFLIFSPFNKTKKNKFEDLWVCVKVELYYIH